MVFNTVTEESERKGLNINITKTKAVVLSKNSPAPRVLVPSGEQRVQQVKRLEYLASVITEDVTCNEEINRKIMIPKGSLYQHKNILTNRKLSVKARKNLVKTYVWSTLLLCSRELDVTVTRLEAMEVWCCRRVMKIP